MINTFVLFVLANVLFLASAFGEMKEAELPRDENGVIIQRDQRLVIPSERKVYQVAPNVVRTEELGDYLERRITKLETKVLELEQRIVELEEGKKK